MHVGGGSCRGFTTKIDLVKHLYIIKHVYLPYLLLRNSQALNVFLLLFCACWLVATVVGTQHTQI